MVLNLTVDLWIHWNGQRKQHNKIHQHFAGRKTAHNSDHRPDGQSCFKINHCRKKRSEAALQTEWLWSEIFVSSLLQRNRIHPFWHVSRLFFCSCDSPSFYLFFFLMCITYCFFLQIFRQNFFPDTSRDFPFLLPAEFFLSRVPFSACLSPVVVLSLRADQTFWSETYKIHPICHFQPFQNKRPVCRIFILHSKLSERLFHEDFSEHKPFPL